MEHEMEYIYAVYQEGTISKAAEKLFITQPALSMALKRVEKKLGNTLFDRSQIPLQLTHAGEIYIQKCREIKLLEQEMGNQINDLHLMQKGTLTIGGTQFILSYVLAPVVSLFSERYPQVTLRILECHSGQAEHLLLNGSIDLYLRSSECPPTLTRIAPAFSDNMLVAMPKRYIAQYNLPKSGLTLSMVQQNEHHKATCPSTDFRLLAHVPYLCLADGNNLSERLRALFRQHSIKPNIKMELEQLTTSYYLADSGIGATLSSEMLIKKSISNHLMFYKVDSPLMTRQFYFVGRRKGYISKASETFIRTVQTHYD